MLTAMLAAILPAADTPAQPDQLQSRVRQAMTDATRYMMDSVSVRGGFVWYYLPDMSRRWGEMEAYPSMAWVQDGGTVSVGNTLLDAYEATGDESYYSSAAETAKALMAGQSRHGGWNYMFDFEGEASMRKWYATIGRNGWRLEEFQHYYGNDTFDDDVTSGAARFLLRIYLVRRDSAFRAALDRAIAFILRSQYANGGWPQRYPLMDGFSKSGRPDYTSFHTFNDEVIWENLSFLMQCRDALGDASLNGPIRKAMDFHLLSQQPNGAWAQQYDTSMNVEGARTYEPKALVPRTTFANSRLLMRFYRITGDRKYLAPIPKAIEWLEATRLPAASTENGRFTHPLFADPRNGRPIYVHRRGSNVAHGAYFSDTVDAKLLSHMSGKSKLDVELLKREYAAHLRLANGQPPEKPSAGRDVPDQKQMEADVIAVLSSLDTRSRWLERHVMTSHPYRGDGVRKEPTDAYASTHVGDSTDTSPFRDPSDRLYVSTPAYIANMAVLIRYLKSAGAAPVIWQLRSTGKVGTHTPSVIGSPQQRVTTSDTSLFFDGKDDGLTIPAIPLEGWPAYTVELRFNPASDGPREPRILHFEDEEGNRGTLEARITEDGRWYLDAFLKNGRTGERVTLMDASKQHPTGVWHTVALTYDGRSMSAYVDGKREAQAEISMGGFTRGNTSIGMRLNRVNWFRGTVSKVAFYPFDKYSGGWR